MLKLQVINLTKKITLADDVVIADTPFKRMLGLLGRKEFTKGQALVIKPCNSVHTFFMLFPIDVAFVDKDNKVIKIYFNLKPWRLGSAFFKSALCIEFPAGSLSGTNIQVGDSLALS